MSSILLQEVSKGKGALQLSGFAAGLNVSFVQDQIPLKNVFWRPCGAFSVPCVGAVDGATIVFSSSAAFGIEAELKY